MLLTKTIGSLCGVGPIRTLSLLAATLFILPAGLAAAQTLATLIAPANGATNVDPGAPFSWNTVSNADAYYVYVGSAPGLKDIINSGALGTGISSLAVGSKLQPNVTYYVRLWTEIGGVWGRNYVDTTFTTGSGTSHLIYPLNGATNVDPFAQFTLTSVPNAISYTVYIGSFAGASDVFNSGPITATAFTATGLQINTLYYARVTTQTSGGSLFVDSTFTTGTGLAHLITPANGAQNVIPGSTFTWNGVSGAQGYYLYIGSSVGAKDIWSSNSTLATTVTPSKLLQGTLYYARTWTEKNNSWFSVDTTFTTGVGTALLTFPANGSTNIDPYVTAAWTTVAGAQSYTLNVGSAPGASNVYSSGAVTATSQLIPGLLVNTKYYVRLITTSGGQSNLSDTSFTTGIGTAHMLSPAPGSTGVDPFALFQWSNVASATGYYVDVGTASGLKDVYTSVALDRNTNQLLVYGLLGGKAYYVAMGTQINGKWYASSFSFTTASQPLPTDVNAFRTNVQNITASVRAMAQGKTNVVIPGTPLAAQMAADGHSVLFCTDFSRTLVQQLMAQHISARVRGVLFDGNNTESHSMNEYYDPFLAKWVVADSDFGLVYYSASTQTGYSVEDISSAVVAGNWSSIPFTYVTSYGSAILNQYYMDVILLYLNPMATGSISIVLPMTNSPAPFLVPAVPGTAGFYLFSFAKSTDVATISNPHSSTSTLSVAPSAGIVYSKVVSLQSNWSISSAPAGLKVFTIERVLF